MRTSLGALALLLAVGVAPVDRAQADQTRLAEIRARLENANQWRDHVMVVAHRGGGVAQGRSLYPENSLAAVRAMIELGVEMVELDIQASKDGEFVVFHDSWLDRSSTCKGELSLRTLAELKGCRLLIEGTGAVSGEPIPTLREVLAVTRDRIFVNIDNKLDLGALAGITALAREMGMADQLVIKANLWNMERVAAAKALMAKAGPGVLFMPIIADDAVRDPAFVETATSAVSAAAVELIAWHGADEPMTADGGPLFSARARAVAARGNWHLWVNTYAIVNKPAGMLSGGRGDQLATVAALPGEAYGFWVDRGATIIQTDEPKIAVDWLAANGFRRPYAEIQPTTTLAASN
ncbi:MAG: glycerophosphodiester phosphodiesterase family protein [Rhizobiaceae bacterium]|nr:glycerophosphodiester phosphodiesterase family protein [Rhizobiaceae bacterium]